MLSLTDQAKKPAAEPITVPTAGRRAESAACPAALRRRGRLRRLRLQAAAPDCRFDIACSSMIGPASRIGLVTSMWKRTSPGRTASTSIVNSAVWFGSSFQNSPRKSNELAGGVATVAARQQQTVFRRNLRLHGDVVGVQCARIGDLEDIGNLVADLGRVALMNDFGA